MNKLALVLFSLATLAHADEGRDLMARFEKASRVASTKAKAVLVNRDADGTEKTKVFTYWRKIQPDQIHYRTLTYFHEPAEIRGEQILFNEQEGDKDDVQMYLPAYKKVRRVERQSHGQSFMNSEFSYADIASPHLDDYTYAVQAASPCADQKPAKVVEVKPKTDDIRDRTGYARLIYWFREDNGMMCRASYYNSKNELIKRLVASDVHEVDASTHSFMSQHLEMENAKNGRRTTIQFSEVDTKVKIPDAKFSVQNLGKD
jgi:hypothetical protein